MVHKTCPDSCVLSVSAFRQFQRLQSILIVLLSTCAKTHVCACAAPCAGVMQPSGNCSTCRKLTAVQFVLCTEAQDGL